MNKLSACIYSTVPDDENYPEAGAGNGAVQTDVSKSELIADYGTGIEIGPQCITPSQNTSKLQFENRTTLSKANSRTPT